MRFPYKKKGALMETNCLLTINDPDELANPLTPLTITFNPNPTVKTRF